MRTSDKIAIGLSMVLLALITLNTVFDDSGDDRKMRNSYCMNVKIWKESGQENGHPNYKNLSCN